MSKVILKKLTLTNFKGIATGEIVFDPIKKTIVAENGSGKSTFMLAYFWLLGMNVGDVIPSIDNKELHELTTKVVGEIIVDDLSYKLECEQNEIWKVNKDTNIREKNGNKSKYSIDDNGFTLTEYKLKLSEIIGLSEYEKLIMLSDKDFFNSNTSKWGWANRRQELFNLCKVNDVLSPIIEKEQYRLIKDEIKKGYSAQEIKKTIKKNIKGYQENKDRNEILIKEKNEEIALYSNYDFISLEKQKKELQDTMSSLTLENIKQNTETYLNKKILEKDNLVSEITKLQIKETTQKNDLQQQVNKNYSLLNDYKSKGERLNDDLKNYKLQVDNFKLKIVELEKSHDDLETNCPVCKQMLPKDNIEQKKQEMLTHKNELLSKYNNSIIDIETKMNTITTELKNLREKFVDTKSQYDESKKQLDEFVSDEKLVEMKSELGKLNLEITELRMKEQREFVGNENGSKLSELEKELSSINDKLAYKTVTNNIKNKIDALRDELQNLTDQEIIAKSKLKQLDAYIKETTSLVNETINSKFSNGVSFSLFDEVYDGESDFKETCICMWNGKTQMSTGEQYFANLEVVKTLQREYGVDLPIWLDNAEAVTIEYFAQQQIIELFAKKGEKLNVLKIENMI